jgi:ribonuclease BN (tRNA processing enzyme)
MKFAFMKYSFLPFLFIANTSLAFGRSSGNVFVTPPEDSTVIVLLGTGTPYPNPHAQGAATALVVGNHVFLFDAGVGVMRQLNAASLPINGVTALFITHLHTDHTLGYADLILTSWVMRRGAPFPVYGPTGLRRMTDHLIAAYEEDITIRTEGLERELPDAWQVIVREIGPGIIYDSVGIRVTAIGVPHGSWREAYGYRVDTPNRSVVISGDTRYSEAIVAASAGVDVLVHEVYSAKYVAPEDRPGGELWPQYMKEFHTSDVELGQLAAMAKPKLLLLTHIIRMGASDVELIDGIRNGGFTGNVVVGRDLGRY